MNDEPQGDTNQRSAPSGKVHRQQIATTVADLVRQDTLTLVAVHDDTAEAFLAAWAVIDAWAARGGRVLGVITWVRVGQSSMVITTDLDGPEPDAWIVAGDPAVMTTSTPAGPRWPPDRTLYLGPRADALLDRQTFAGLTGVNYDGSLWRIPIGAA